MEPVPQLNHDLDLSEFEPFEIPQIYFGRRFLYPTNFKAHGYERKDLKASFQRERVLASFAFHIDANCPDHPSRRPEDYARLYDKLREHAGVNEGYSLWTRCFPDDWFVYMNLGYHPFQKDEFEAYPPLEGLDLDWQYQAYLYYKVLNGTDLTGKEVIEVGSGRGGGASLLARSMDPARYLGVDRCASNVLFCKERHPLNGLDFTQGIAEQLPIQDNSYDVLINVESCLYYQLPQFLGEAFRVLRSGGQFFVTANYDTYRFFLTLEEQALAKGFKLVRMEDITLNARLGWQQSDFLGLVQKYPTSYPKLVMDWFDYIVDRDYYYVTYHFQKP